MALLHGIGSLGQADRMISPHTESAPHSCVHQTRQGLCQIHCHTVLPGPWFHMWNWLLHIRGCLTFVLNIFFYWYLHRGGQSNLYHRIGNRFYTGRDGREDGTELTEFRVLEGTRWNPRAWTLRDGGNSDLRKQGECPPGNSEDRCLSLKSGNKYICFRHVPWLTLTFPSHSAGYWLLLTFIAVVCLCLPKVHVL